MFLNKKVYILGISSCDMNGWRTSFSCLVTQAIKKMNLHLAISDFYTTFKVRN